MTQHEATYILQWSHFDRTAGLSGGQDMLDMLTHPQHKAKVMFYCEVLNSLDYRGSMTSLQSTQSGFSCISKVSGHHSTSGVSSGVSSSLSETGGPLKAHHSGPAPDEIASWHQPSCSGLYIDPDRASYSLSKSAGKSYKKKSPGTKKKKKPPPLTIPWLLLQPVKIVLQLYAMFIFTCIPIGSYKICSLLVNLFISFPSLCQDKSLLYS